MRHKDSDFAFVLENSARDLCRGQDKPARRVQDQIERYFRISQMNGAQNFLAIVDVDVTEDRETQKTHGFLSVHEKDDTRLAFSLDNGDEPFARCFQQTLCDDGLQSRQHEKQPK